MRLTEAKLTNFRCYEQETVIPLEPLTVLVGRNDSGKSSILDALDIYFNDSAIEKDDCCVRSGSDEVRIACVFDDLPTTLVIDEQFPTSLQAEYLVRTDGRLEVARIFKCVSAKGKAVGAVAKACHPSTDQYHDLLELKNRDLKKRAHDLGVDLTNVNETTNSQLRAAIWRHTAGLAPQERDVDLGSETGKKVWEQLQKHLPVYAVFRSDRASTDQDAEAQDPMKAAIREAIRKREADLGGVIADIRTELALIAGKTVDKIREMSPELASELNPQVKNKNWDSLFSVSLTGDEQIPINKRGSGTRRLVLLNFFRAKAEEQAFGKSAGVIYAIEEPETSQHPNHQAMLLDVFQELVEQGRCQILITTHTPTLARRVERHRLRLITADNRRPVILHGRDDATLRAIKDTLGVLPDHDVKAFVGVEGRHDIQFLRRISRILAATEADIPDLGQEEVGGRLVFIPLGGSSLDLWVTTLAGLERPEFYLTDRDNPPPRQPKYQAQITEWANRGCTAWATSKKELENYLHLDAIKAEVPTYPGTGADFEDVPLLFAEAVHGAEPAAPPWGGLDEEKKKEKSSRAKKRLNTVCADRMTPALLTQSDPTGDVRSWLRSIGTALRA